MTMTPAIRPSTALLRNSEDRGISAALRLSEDSVWPEDQDQDEHAERNDVPQLVWRRHAEPAQEEVGAYLLQQSEGQSAEHGTDDVSDPAEDRGGERLDARQEPHEPVDLPEDQGVQDAGRPCQEAADGER